MPSESAEKENIRKVITIENLTIFFSWKEEGSLMIYLGDYHNLVRRELLRMVYRELPDAKYLHFGDIDVEASGYIRLMPKDTDCISDISYGDFGIEKYEKYTKKLTDNDRKGLQMLIEKERAEKGENLEVLLYMLDKGVKLEQEAVRG